MDPEINKPLAPTTDDELDSIYDDLDAELDSIYEEVEQQEAQVEEAPAEEPKGPSFYEQYFEGISLGDTLKNAGKAIWEIPDTLTDVAVKGTAWAGGAVVDLLDNYSRIKSYMSSSQYAYGGDFGSWYKPIKAEEAIREFVGPPESGVEGFLAETTKYAILAAASGGALAAAGAGPAVASIGGGAIADAFLMPTDENLANLYQEYLPEAVQNPVVDFMAAGEDDSEAEKALKAAAVGAIPSFLVERLVKHLRFLKAVKKGDKVDPKLLEELAQDPLAEFHGPQNVARDIPETFQDPLADFHTDSSRAPDSTVVGVEADLQAVVGADPAPQPRVNDPLAEFHGPEPMDLGGPKATNKVADEAPPQLPPKTPGARIIRSPSGEGYEVLLNGERIGEPFRTFKEAQVHLATAEAIYANDQLPFGAILDEELAKFVATGDASQMRIGYAQTREEAFKQIDRLSGTDVPVHRKVGKKPAEGAAKAAPEVDIEVLQKRVARYENSRAKALANAAKNPAKAEYWNAKAASAEKRLKTAQQKLLKASGKAVEETAEAAPAANNVLTFQQMAEELFPGRTGNDALAEAQRVLGNRNLFAGMKGLYNWTHAQMANIERLAAAVREYPSNAAAVHELGRALDTLGAVFNPAKYDVNAEMLAGEALDALSTAKAKATPNKTAKKAPGSPQEARTVAGEGGGSGKPPSSSTAASRASPEGPKKQTSGGPPKVFAGETPEQVARKIAFVDAAQGDPRAINGIINSPSEALASKIQDPVKKKGFWEYVRGGFIEMILSGPWTHFWNVTTTGFNSLWKPMTNQWLGGTSERLFGNKDLGAAMMQEGRDVAMGLFLDWRENLKMAAKAYKSGKSLLDPGSKGTLDSAAHSLGELNWGNGLTTQARRLLMMEDEFFKQANYRAKMRAETLRKLRDEGVSDPKEIARRLKEATVTWYDPETGSAVNKDGLKYAQQATFTEPLEYGSLPHLAQQASQHPVVGLFVPFVRTPYRVFETAWQYTPVLNRLNKAHMADIRAGGERAAMARGRTLFGTSAFGVAGVLAYNGLITGAPPTDPDLAKRLRDDGWRPYSFRIPQDDGQDIFIPYNKMYPFTLPFALTADLIAISGELEEQQWYEAGAAVIAALTHTASDQTFVKDYSTLADAVMARDGDTIMSILQDKLVSMTTPAFIAQTNPDEYFREARTLIDRYKSRVWWLSETLPPRMNIFGEKVPKEPGFGVPNPLGVSVVKDEEWEAELHALGKGFPAPSPTIGVNNSVDLRDIPYVKEVDGKTVTWTAYERLHEILGEMRDDRGRTIKQQIIEDYINTDWYQEFQKQDGFNNPGGPAWNELNVFLQENYAEALEILRGEFPGIGGVDHLIERSETQFEVGNVLGVEAGKKAAEDVDAAWANEVINGN